MRSYLEKATCMFLMAALAVVAAMFVSNVVGAEGEGGAEWDSPVTVGTCEERGGEVVGDVCRYEQPLTDLVDEELAGAERTGCRVISGNGHCGYRRAWTTPAKCLALGEESWRFVEWTYDD